jgi:mono/diheme cytochrome c family protein
MKNRYSFLIVLVVICNTGFVFSQNPNWIAPSTSNNLINPFKGNVNATKEGKMIYSQMCILCHGIQGKGNGEAGLSLERKPANFLALKVVNQTDGNIFWKITNGKAPMATYEELLTDDQRWKLVNYIRELEINKAKK